jgi:hypothetical protein
MSFVFRLDRIHRSFAGTTVVVFSFLVEVPLKNKDQRRMVFFHFLAQRLYVLIAKKLGYGNCQYFRLSRMQSTKKRQCSDEKVSKFGLRNSATHADVPAFQILAPTHTTGRPITRRISSMASSPMQRLWMWR